MLPLRIAAALVVSLAMACLRAPIEGESFDDGADDEGSTGELEEPDGLSMSGPLNPAADTSESGDATGCHPSYVPCLPITGDLDCDEVRALGAAPVDVVGEDAYHLDADADGIGCET